MSKETCVQSEETWIQSKETYIQSKETYIHSKETCVLSDPECSFINVYECVCVCVYLNETCVHSEEM